MTKLLLYIHGKGGNAAESLHYKHLFPDYDVIGFDYESQTPWEAKAEFASLFDSLCKNYDSVKLIANSIGAFFSMNSLQKRNITEAFFISPIVNMEKLICDMMTWVQVTEDDLREKDEIPTSFGEVLSWQYLCYVRNNPIEWTVPTKILYGANDNLTSFETVAEFAKKTGASLTVMKNGEHWFHTDEQISFLDNWIKGLMAKK